MFPFICSHLVVPGRSQDEPSPRKIDSRKWGSFYPQKLKMQLLAQFARRGKQSCAAECLPLTDSKLLIKFLRDRSLEWRRKPQSRMFMTIKYAKPCLLRLAAIHEVLVLKSAHASFTTPLVRVPVHSKRGLPQNKGFGGARANHGE